MSVGKKEACCFMAEGSYGRFPFFPRDFPSPNFAFCFEPTLVGRRRAALCFRATRISFRLLRAELADHRSAGEVVGEVEPSPALPADQVDLLHLLFGRGAIPLPCLHASFWFFFNCSWNREVEGMSHPFVSMQSFGISLIFPLGITLLQSAHRTWGSPRG